MLNLNPYPYSLEVSMVVKCSTYAQLYKKDQSDYRHANRNHRHLGSQRDLINELKDTYDVHLTTDQVRDIIKDPTYDSIKYLCQLPTDNLKKLVSYIWDKDFEGKDMIIIEYIRRNVELDEVGKELYQECLNLHKAGFKDTFIAEVIPRITGTDSDKRWFDIVDSLYNNIG